MKRNDELLRRILCLIQKHRIDNLDKIPTGFASRIVSQWAMKPRSINLLSQWELLCRRAVIGMAIATVIVCLAVWYSWLPVHSEDSTALMAQITELIYTP